VIYTWAKFPFGFLQLGGSLIDTVTVPVGLLGMEVMLPTPPQLTVMLAIIKINNAHTTTLAFSPLGTPWNSPFVSPRIGRSGVFPPNHYPDLNWKPCRLLITPSTKSPAPHLVFVETLATCGGAAFFIRPLEMLPHLSMVSLT
jgi:hypothetical protein